MTNNNKLAPIIAKADDLLTSFHLNTRAFDKMLENLKAARTNMDIICQKIVTDLQIEYINLMDKLSKITDDYLAGEISAEKHDATRLKLIKKRNKVLEDILSYNLADDRVVVLTRIMVDIVQGKSKPIAKMKVDEQKMLIKAMFKEYKIENGKVVKFKLTDAFKDIITLNFTVTIPDID